MIRMRSEVRISKSILKTMCLTMIKTWNVECLVTIINGKYCIHIPLMNRSLMNYHQFLSAHMWSVFMNAIDMANSFRLKSIVLDCGKIRKKQSLMVIIMIIIKI